MADRPDCRNFADLRARYRENVDYKVDTRPGDLRLFVVAPHGGLIEPGTDGIARAIAGTDLSLHVLEGIKLRANPRLHIESHRYDQPDALELAGRCRTAIGIHGKKPDAKGDVTIWIGGLNNELAMAVAASLRAAGFRTIPAKGKIAATDSNNICNRAINSGVQLEMPPELRNRLCSEAALMTQFVLAVRSGMGVTP